MISRYEIFCKVIETKSFTKAAASLGYSQSAVSQTVKALETEMGVLLVDRRKDGLCLTADGEQYFPYFQAIRAAEQALMQKRREMDGLTNSAIRLGTFTSVSRTILPALMQAFQTKHPSVSFVLRQGEYTSIGRWILDGSVDFGFIGTDAVSGIETKVLYEDEMMAVLPPGHPLALPSIVSLKELASEPFILLDEGDFSVPLAAFEKRSLRPEIKYEVYDDDTILAMVRQGLGVSLIYRRVLTGSENNLEIRPVQNPPKRTISLAWKNWSTMPYASRKFVEFILAHTDFSGNIDLPVR